MTTFAPTFDVEMSLRIDQPTFKAGEWFYGIHTDGRATRSCTCYEVEGGKWEGFVSMEFVG